MFVKGEKLMLFGNTREEMVYGEPEPMPRKPGAEIYPHPYYTSLTTVQLWDVSDRSSPQLVRSVDFEGSYLSSRMIENRVFFVINSYPKYKVLENQREQGDIVPLYRERDREEIRSGEEKELEKTCRCSEVAYLEPVNAQRFITLVSMSISDPKEKINKKVVVGSGQNIYASLQNLYVAEVNYHWFPRPLAEPGRDSAEETVVHKFSLDEEGGKIEYQGNTEVPGRVLNQFSMDEYNGHFRIATTTGHVSMGGGGTSNNIYIFDSDLERVGELEDLAPGDKIYSARFMGDRGYLVTFKKTDPLFALNLSDPTSPGVLGKLKIPGYSDYLHPYDENHLIGIGKETVPAEEARGDFAWYQGVKMTLFNVSDVENPREMGKVVIGDRGTDSPVLRDHKAFLFDRNKNLLAIPILLAEIQGNKSELPPNTRGDYIYQGAYVYRLTLEDGFDLQGRITHYESEEPFQKSGYYFRGEYSIERSLYIDNILYTISNNKIKLNSLEDLTELKEPEFGS